MSLNGPRIENVGNEMVSVMLWMGEQVPVF